MGEQSLSQASTAGAPVTAEADGWKVQSSSAVRPTQEELQKSLSDAIAATPDDPKPAETEPPAEPETPPAEGVTSPVTSDEGAKKADEAAPVAAKPVLPEPKKKQSRADKITAEINGLTWQKNRILEDTAAAKAERQRLSQEIEDLNKQKAALQPGTSTTAPESPKAPAKKPTLNTSPKPRWGGADGYEASGKTFEEYETDHEEWILEEARLQAAASSEQVIQSREESAREASQRAAVEEGERRLSAQSEELIIAARQRYPAEDVDAALKATIPIYDDATARRHNLPPMPGYRPIRDVLRTSEVRVELLMYFHRNPEEAERIGRTPAFQAVREMAYLEERIRAAQAGPAATTERTVSSARPVISPVTGGAPNARDTRSPGEAEETIPFGPEYLRAANRRLGMR